LLPAALGFCAELTGADPTCWETQFLDRVSKPFFIFRVEFYINYCSLFCKFLFTVLCILLILLSFIPLVFGTSKLADRLHITLVPQVSLSIPTLGLLEHVFFFFFFFFFFLCFSVSVYFTGQFSLICTTYEHYLLSLKKYI